MKRTGFLAGAAWSVFAVLVAQGNDENLVRNGAFEAGHDGQPDFWSPVDNLTTHWGEEGKSGRCLRFETNVSSGAKRAADAGKPHRPEPGGKYDVVGAHEGVGLYSYPVRIRPDDRYFIIEADVFGPAKSTKPFYPQVLIRGYQRYRADKDRETSSWFHTPHPGKPAFSRQYGKRQRPARDGDYLMVFRHGLVCRLPQKGKWYHFRMGFKLPGMRTSTGRTYSCSNPMPCGLRARTGSTISSCAERRVPTMMRRAETVTP